MGGYHLEQLVEMEGARVLAVCDVYEPRRRAAARTAPDADRYTDFRAVLDRSDVEAVLVATPDHWHAPITVRACEAGKDVYVEKPASLTIPEGRAMVEAARRHQSVVQVGTQQRSNAHFREAVRRIQTGELGAISHVRAWNFSNDGSAGIGRPPNRQPPPNLDWDLYLGPAEWRPYNPNYYHRFRQFFDFAGGRMTDWGVHHIDIVQWALGGETPKTARASGGIFVTADNRETPDTLKATFGYPSAVLEYETRRGNARPIAGRGYGIQFFGTAGTLIIDRSGYEIIPEDGSDLSPETREAEPGSSHRRHKEDFLTAVRERSRPRSDVAIGHRSTATAHLGNLAYRTGSTLRWDAESESIRENEAAAELMGTSHRAPWTV